MNDAPLLTHDRKGTTADGGRRWRKHGDSMAGEAPGKATPPPHSRFPTRFPRGATLDIVCPRPTGELEEQRPNNIKNGTSAAHGPFREALRKIEIRNSKFEIGEPICQTDGRTHPPCVRIPLSFPR